MKTSKSLVAIVMIAIFVLAIVTATAVLTFLYSTNAGVANAESNLGQTKEELAESYTDSDLVYGTQVTIDQYPNAAIICK